MTLIPRRNKPCGREHPEDSRVLSLRSEIDRLFDTFIREPFSTIDWPFTGGERWAPAIDIAETDDEVIVRSEMPGIDPEELDVSIAGNQLVISGEKQESVEDRDRDFQHTETRYGTFRRSVQLPEGIDADNVDARYSNGVLTLRLKKTGPAEATRVEVKVKD